MRAFRTPRDRTGDPDTMTLELLVPTLALISLVPVFAFILPRHTARQRAVTAECLVCTYTEPRKDVTAAKSAALHHGATTGHPLMLRKPE